MDIDKIFRRPAEQLSIIKLSRTNQRLTAAYP